MSLKAIVDEVPEGLADHYTKREDGKFQLAVDAVGGFALEDVSGLKSALGKERTNRQDLEHKLSAFGDLDVDAAKHAIERVKELESFDPKKEADRLASERFEAASKTLGEKHKAEVDKRDARIKQLTSTVDGMVRKQKATEELAKAKGSVELLMPHILSHTRTVENDGKYSVEVVDDYGNVKTNGSGGNMNLSEFVAELKANDAFGRAFEASGTTGSGMESRGRAASGAGKGDMGGSREERQAAIAARHPGIAAK